MKGPCPKCGEWQDGSLHLCAGPRPQLQEVVDALKRKEAAQYWPEERDKLVARIAELEAHLQTENERHVQDHVRAEKAEAKARRLLAACETALDDMRRLTGPFRDNEEIAACRRLGAAIAAEGND